MVGLLAAVLDARATGRGRDVDTDLYDAALAMLSYPATWYLSAGIAQRRLPLSAHPSVVPFGFFATADGHIAVATPKERFFGDLVRAMDLPELASDERFADMASRSRNRDALVGALGARFAELTTDEWMTRLRGVVPAAPVQSMERALETDRLRARRMLAEYDHPTLGTVRSVGVPLFLSDFEPAYRPGPGMGADEGRVLAELGYDDEAVDALRARGAFGSVRESPSGTEAATAASGAAL
jgi:crotonobetainyl-CoA:carnitine CoA-transferase CaiB-like acyl-CoA transferase